MIKYYYSAIRMWNDIWNKKEWITDTTWMGFKGNVLNENSQSQNFIYIIFLKWQNYKNGG